MNNSDQSLVNWMIEKNEEIKKLESLCNILVEALNVITEDGCDFHSHEVVARIALNKYETIRKGKK